jgi:hypothetical protein
MSDSNQIDKTTSPKLNLKPQSVISIDTEQPNPFTSKPLLTAPWTSNELLLSDPKMRLAAGIGQLDIAQYQVSLVNRR